MRIIILFITLCLSMPSMAQKYYIKTYDPHNFEGEEIRDMRLEGQNIIFGGTRKAKSNQNFSTVMGKFSIATDSMIKTEKIVDVEFGFSLLKLDNDYLLSSLESTNLKNIIVSVVDSNFKLKKTVDLKLPQSRYFNYVIREAIQFGDKSVISAIVLDTLNQYSWNGVMQCREKLALFVLDKQQKLDTAFLITPNNNYWMAIQGLGVGSDSTVYVSIYERNLTYTRKAIYGYNKQFKKVYTWVGPEIIDKSPARSSLAIGNDGTVYTAYYQANSRTFLYAIDKLGKQKWACPLDSFMIKGGWDGFSLAIAKNGDLLGSATISSAMDDLGECAYLFRINPQGKMLWNKILRLNKGMDTYQSPTSWGLSLLPFKLVELPNGDIIIGGQHINFLGKNYPNSPSYNDDIFIARTDSTGCLWKDCPYIQDVVQKPKYLPIVTARNEWVSNNPNIAGQIEPFSTTINTFTSDSFLLNNKYYFRLRYKKSLDNIWKTGSTYFREKDGIVYFKKDGTTAEVVLYNLNAGIGDTLPSMGKPTGIRIVKTVSTVMYADGIPRKKMTFVKPCDIAVVEGIGDIAQLFSSLIDCSLTMYEGLDVVRCFNTDGKLVYKASGIQGCYTVAVKDVDVRLKSIYPNPTTGLLNIDIEDAQAIKSVTIVDNLGRIIQMDDFEAAENGIQLNISTLQNGLYFGKVAFSDGSKTGFKIIKASE